MIDTIHFTINASPDDLQLMVIISACICKDMLQ